MGPVFISYSRRDTETVDHIVQSLNEAGMEVWLDRQDIRAGNSWRLQIVQAIDTCDAFVLMLSPNSAASDNVRKEIDLAQDSGRTIFPVMLEPVKIPAEIRYQLAGLQLINVQMLGFEKAVSQLTDTLKEHLAKQRRMEAEKTRQAELVIQGIDLKSFGAEKCEQLLNFVAQLTNVNRSGLAIANMTAGSVHVFVEMPAGSAYQLKTFALNRDKRFKRIGIASLRLVGDKKYINIALGVLTAAATIGILQAIWLGTPSLFMPVVGATIGKVLTISLAVAVTAGVAVSAPKAVAPLFFPSPTPTLTPTFTPLPIPASSTPTLWMKSPLPELTQPPELTRTPKPESTPTDLPSPTATPQDPLVLAYTACFREPRVNERVVSRLDKGIRVKVVGRSDTGSWWLIENPFYHSLCWVQMGDLQLDPGMKIEDIPIFYIFSRPTPKGCTENTTYDQDPDCYCMLHEDWRCYYHTPGP